MLGPGAPAGPRATPGRSVGAEAGREPPQVPGNAIVPAPFRSLLTPERLISFGFLLLILLGTGLLLLPASTVEGISLLDALFTSTSASCVTGLAVLDTGTRFTRFGQGVILLLIQLGGLGIMTLSIAFLYLVAGRVSLFNREVLEDSLSLGPVRGLLPLLVQVLRITLVIEGLGALLLTARFLQQMPPGEALFSGIFHAVSAFCNAGFALSPDSLFPWRNDLLVNTVVMALITAGGLGFLVLSEVHGWWRGGRRTALSLGSRVVLYTSGLLVVLGALAFLALEWGHSLRVEHWTHVPQVMLHSLFQSVSCRTAGFNTVPLDALSAPTYLVLILLMAIGASPASSGGGIKTTTFVVLLAHLRSRFLDRRDTELGGRRIPEATVSRAVTIVIFSVLVIAAGTLLLLVSESRGMSSAEESRLFLQVIFEAVSAFATVGLSTGLTPDLTPVGKLLVIVLMFIGRIGPLALALALGKRRQPGYRLATGNVTVG
jgi:trk system potassium uptake protein TrkH